MILWPPTHLGQPCDRSLITRKVTVGRLFLVYVGSVGVGQCQCCSHTLGLQLCQAQLFTCLQIFILTLRMPMSLQDQVRELYCRSDRFYCIWTLVCLYLVALHCWQVSPHQENSKMLSHAYLYLFALVLKIRSFFSYLGLKFI